MVQINWTNLAVEDLKGIYDYISRDSTKYAKIQVVRLRARTNVLKKHPLSGKPVPEYSDDNFRELIEGNYRIIYKSVSVERIDILTIHHLSRDLEKRQIG
mgnify:CR=1 FL=1